VLSDGNCSIAIGNPIAKRWDPCLNSQRNRDAGCRVALRSQQPTLGRALIGLDETHRPLTPALDRGEVGERQA
jgi:hypothetical protein